MAAKKSLSTRSGLIKEIDCFVSVITRYGSAIKKGSGFYCVCVSCGKTFPLRKIDAGHFIRRGCLPLRFDPTNVHPECIADNRMSPDHLVGYSNYIIKHYGSDKIGQLLKVKRDWESGKIKPYKIIELKKIYTDRLNQVREIEKKWNIKLIPANRVPFNI